MYSSFVYHWTSNTLSNLNPCTLTENKTVDLTAEREQENKRET
jgi:hypothetical protein